MAKLPEGVSLRHQRGCAKHRNPKARCTCKPAYQAQVYDRVTRRKKSKTFGTSTAARNWRHDALVSLRRGTFRPGRQVTICEAGAEWLEAARAGLVRNRSGDTYKPSALRAYADALRVHIYPALGGISLDELRRRDLDGLIRRWLAQGASPSTVRNRLMPLRAIYRRALWLDDLAVNPLDGLQLPAVQHSDMRIAPPEEAAGLLAALPDTDRPLWATALYAGLRRGELQALDVADVDLASGLIRVAWNWDRKEGRVRPKSKAGRRSVPVPAVLRDELLEHRMRLGRERGLIFGRTHELAFTPDVPQRRADRIWRNSGLSRIGLHECRHTYASFMIAAGVNAKALSTFMGHASIAITLDRYGHLFPGAEDEAAELLDGYLARANSEARKAAVS